MTAKGFEFFRRLFDYFTCDREEAGGEHEAQKRAPSIPSKKNRFVLLQEKKRRRNNLNLPIFICLLMLYSYLAELAFPAYAYVDGHRLLSLLPPNTLGDDSTRQQFLLGDCTSHQCEVR
jgi:hypothetical protein